MNHRERVAKERKKATVSGTLYERTMERQDRVAIIAARNAGKENPANNRSNPKSQALKNLIDECERT